MAFAFHSPLAESWSAAAENPLAAALAELRSAGHDVIDLVSANPHEHGLRFPDDVLADIVGRTLQESPSVHVYSPDSLGQHEAREAVADFYRRRGEPADPARIVLTPGTSMAYFYALRLLTRAGDDVLAPKPGYPLFDNLCELCGLRLRHYHLRESAEGWRPDPEEIAWQCTPRTRVLMLVSPHNPTGMVLRPEELEAIAAVARRKNLAVIFDEVFSEFLQHPGQALPRPRAEQFPLVLTLNGFSKMFSLPGWKFGWMKIDGDDAAVRPLLAALEQMSDTFLPVNELVQATAPTLFDAGREVSERLSREYAERRALAHQLSPRAAHLPESGVYLALKLPPSDESELNAVLRLLRDHHVHAHPGFYYDLPGHLVITCVPRPELIREGMRRIGEALSR
jgi:aspartate/methionine/tyrosine aminotransferase